MKTSLLATVAATALILGAWSGPVLAQSDKAEPSSDMEGSRSRQLPFRNDR